MDRSCFEVVFQILQARDTDCLIKAMEAVIAEALPDVHTQIFEVISTSTIEFRPYGSRSLESGDPERQLMQAYLLKDVIHYSDSSGNNTAIYPVSGVGKIKLLIKVDTAGADVEILEQLILLFRSQYILMDKNNHDALTSLFNRQAFEEKMLGLIKHAQRRDESPGERHCFALLDIDHFKNVNDTYGHLYGDEVLILFAGIMGQTFRSNDLLFRYGGEEFAVLLRDVSLDIAQIVLERFRSNVELYEFPQIGRITMSAGVAEVTDSPTVVSLVESADKALYYSKENGRNQVNSYERLVAAGKISANEISQEGDIELF